MAPDPDSPAAALLAQFLEAQGRGDFAGALPPIEALARGLPDNPQIRAWHAFTLDRLGRLRESVAAYDAALVLQPGHADAAFNRACVLARLDDPAAEAGFAAVLALRPDHAGARAALADRRARRLQPAFATALAHDRAGRHGEAEAAYRALLREWPDNVALLQNLASLLAPRDAGAAIGLWQQALGLEPDNPVLRAALGQFLFQRGQLAAAIPHLEAVVAREPRHTAIAELVQAKADLCAWDDLARLTPLLRDAIAHDVPVVPMAAVRFGDDDPALVARAGRRFMRHLLERAFPDGIVPFVHARPAAPRERIRVGYLSSDLRGHIIGLLLASVLERHDRGRFELHAYALGQRRDPTTDRIRAAVEGFHDVAGATPAAVAARIAADGIDVLVELNGFTRDGCSEALAPRPAPVQMQWLGYPGTSGGDFVDYVIADAVTLPAGVEAWFGEKLLRLPFTHQPFDIGFPAAPTPSRDALGLPDDALVLASLVPHWKLTPALFGAWMRVMAALPDSVLWLVEAPVPARHALEATAAAAGVAPHRLVFAGKVPMAEFLGRLPAADLFLDTFPYGGHSTTSAALAAGLPIVALTGRGFASRVAGSVLHAAGLEALATTSLADYEALALALGRDRARLAALRARVVAARTGAPLFDLDRFVRALEAGYAAAWDRWCRNLPADHITVPRDQGGKPT